MASLVVHILDAPTHGGNDATGNIEYSVTGSIGSATGLAGVPGAAWSITSTDSVSSVETDVADFERTDPFSIWFWIKRPDPANFVQYITKYEPTAGIGWRIATGNPRDTFNLNIANSGATNRVSSRTMSKIADDEWTHVAITYDGNWTTGSYSPNHFKYYFNGVAVPFLQVVGDLTTQSISNTEPIVIAGDADSTPIAYQDIRIFSGETSSEEVADYFHCSTPRPDGYRVLKSWAFIDPEMQTTGNRDWLGRGLWVTGRHPGVKKQDIVPYIMRGATAHDSTSSDSVINIVYYQRSTDTFSEINKDINGNALASWPADQTDLTGLGPTQRIGSCHGFHAVTPDRIILVFGIHGTAGEADRGGSIQAYSTDNCETFTEEGQIPITNMSSFVASLNDPDKFYSPFRGYIRDNILYAQCAEINSGSNHIAIMITNNDPDAAYDNWSQFAEVGDASNGHISNEWSINIVNNEWLCHGVARNGTGTITGLSYRTVSLDGATLGTTTSITSQVTNETMAQPNAQTFRGVKSVVLSGGRQPAASNQSTYVNSNRIYVSDSTGISFGKKFNLYGIKPNTCPSDDSGYGDCIHLGGRTFLYAAYTGKEYEEQGQVFAKVVIPVQLEESLRNRNSTRFRGIRA